MNEAKIILAPCRLDMPLTGVLRSSLAEQFPGMIEIVPPLIPRANICSGSSFPGMCANAFSVLPIPGA